MLKQNTEHKTTETIKGTLYTMITMQVKLLNITVHIITIKNKHAIH
jgi:uncharacterized alkaline shock family protein YloU